MVKIRVRLGLGKAAPYLLWGRKGEVTSGRLLEEAEEDAQRVGHEGRVRDLVKVRVRLRLRVRLRVRV